MASPQCENGYTKIANEILDKLVEARIPGEQIRCLLFILRQTYGFNRKEAELSYAEIAQATGISRRNAVRSMQELVSKLTLGVVKTDTSGKLTYRFNKDYEQWMCFSRRELGVVKKDTTLLSKRTPLPIKDNIKEKETNYIAQSGVKKDTTKFDEFWKAYPKKRSKGDAEKAWKSVKANSHFKEILEAVEKQKQSWDWKKDGGQFIPYPATWLRRKKWEDEIDEGHVSDDVKAFFAGVDKKPHA